MLRTSGGSRLNQMITNVSGVGDGPEFAGEPIDREAGYASTMSTETSILDSLASVKITPLTGGTSP